MANISALLFTSLDDVNWAGFYFMDSPTELVLGPFQGNPACIRIPVGKGCMWNRRCNRTNTINRRCSRFFDGHIACDAASNSEVVVPIMKAGKVFAVLDIDSPSISRFDTDNQAGLEALVKCLEASL